MEKRLEQVMNLQEFIETNRSKICEVLSAISWNEKCTKKDFKEASNKDDSSTIDQYNLDSITQTAPGESTFMPKVPIKFCDIQTREEKLEFYEYVIENADKPKDTPIPKSTHLDSAEKKITFEEIIAFKRNLKRRRLKHRTTKELPLSQTEEFRQLIDLQMQALIQYNQTENCSNSTKPSSSTNPVHTDDTNYYKRIKSKSKKEHKKRSRSREKRPDEYRRKAKEKKRKRSRSTDGHRSREKKNRAEKS